MIPIHQKLKRLLPASTETSIPLVFTAETRSVSHLLFKLRWSSLTTGVLSAATAVHGPVVPDYAWWAILAGAAVDTSVFSYQRFRRR